MEVARSRLQEGQRRDVVVVNHCQEERRHAGHHHVHVDIAATQDGVHRRCFLDIHRLKELSRSRGVGEPRPVPCTAPELELELIQSHMAQMPMLRGEVGARALRVRSDVRGHGQVRLCNGVFSGKTY